jgi:hypothetical protein
MNCSVKSLYRRRAIAVFIGTVIGAQLTAHVSFGAEPQNGPSDAVTYQAIDGNVDQNTFQGWRVFHSVCHVCHGTGATGTDIAPSLPARVRSMTPREFAERVLVRYRLLYPGDARASANPTREREAVIEEVMAKKRGPKGRISMPGWERDEEISVHILDLYAYLSARADGMIGPGKPGILPPR